MFNSSLNQWLKCRELHQSAVDRPPANEPTEQFRCESPHLLCGPRGRSPLASRHSRTVSLRRFYSTDLVIQLGKEPANIWLQMITAKLMTNTIIICAAFPLASCWAWHVTVVASAAPCLARFPSACVFAVTNLNRWRYFGVVEENANIEDFRKLLWRIFWHTWTHTQEQFNSYMETPLRIHIIRYSLIQANKRYLLYSGFGLQ